MIAELVLPWTESSLYKNNADPLWIMHTIALWEVTMNAKEVGETKVNYPQCVYLPMLGHLEFIIIIIIILLTWVNNYLYDILNFLGEKLYKKTFLVFYVNNTSLRTDKSWIQLFLSHDWGIFYILFNSWLLDDYRMSLSSHSMWLWVGTKPVFFPPPTSFPKLLQLHPLSCPKLCTLVQWALGFFMIIFLYILPFFILLRKQTP